MRLWLALGVSVLWATALIAQDAGDASARISVSGEGTAAAVPDMATITLGVSAQNASAAEAMEEASASISDILARLDGLGLQPRDIQTSDLSLTPLWSNRASGSASPPRIEGFEASNRLTLRVRDLDTLGAVLEAAISDGANRLGGLSFGLRDPGPVLDAARRNAVADARRRAEVYAQAAGLTLGPVISMSEGGASAPRPQLAMEMARAADVPIAAGETAIRAQINVVYALLP